MDERNCWRTKIWQTIALDQKVPNQFQNHWEWMAKCGISPCKVSDSFDWWNAVWNDKRTQWWMTENQIGDEGMKSLSEMLKLNTTITTLSLDSEWQKKRNTKWMDLHDVFWFGFQTMGLETKGQKHLVIHSRQTQSWKHCLLKVGFVSSHFDIKHNSPQHNHRQQDWWWRSEIIEWNAEIEHHTDKSLPAQWMAKEKKHKRNELALCALIWFSDNGVGNEGAKALGDSLKTNTILKTLWLGGEIYYIRLWHSTQFTTA